MIELMIGTRLHQQTRTSIKKRSKPLTNAILKYNGYCETIRDLAGPTPAFPLPQPLPTELSELRDHNGLLDDVWIASDDHPDPPAWLVNPLVHEGICARLDVDHIGEEFQCLHLEASNMHQWYYHQLTVTHIALHAQHDLRKPLIILVNAL